MIRFYGLQRFCRFYGLVLLLAGLIGFAGCMQVPRAPQTPPHWMGAPPTGDPFSNVQPQAVPPQQPTLAPQIAPVPDESPEPTFDDEYSAPMPVESFRVGPLEPEIYINPNVQPPRLEAPTIVPQEVTVPAVLRLDVKAPERNTVGAVSVFEISLQNTGDQQATEVVIESRFEEGFIFPGSDDKQVIQTIGTLSAGETRDLKLSLRADRAGHHCVEFSLKAKDAKTINKKVCVEYRDTSASLEVHGPAKRMVGGRAEWNATLVSRDLLPAANARMVLDYDSTYLKPVGGSEGAQQDLGRITWDLGRVEASERVELQVEFECLMPAESTCLTFAVSADGDLEETVESCLAIERRQGALDVDLEDVSDPLKIGGEIDYMITVTNRDLRSVHEVGMTATLPGLFRAVSTEVREGRQRLLGVRSNVQGSLVRFETVDVLAPDATLTYRIQAKAVQAGTGRLLVSVSSDDIAGGKIRLEEVSTVVE